MRTVSIPQIDGVIRVVALREEEYETVRMDPPLIDRVRHEGIAEIAPGGLIRWITIPTRAGRWAILRDWGRA
jgi:hypothetical protein